MRFRCIARVTFGACVAVLALDASAREHAEFPRSSGIIDVHGEPHTYLTEGRGETCIVTGLAPQYPPLFSARLKQHIRFVFVDFKNSWGAPPDHGIDSTTMDSLVEEVDDVRKALGIERACIIGHSSTGLVAIEYAARHPDRTSRVILVSVHPFWNKELFAAWRTFWESDASPERKAALADNVRRMPNNMLSTLSPRDAFALKYARNGPQLFYDPSYDFYWAWAGRQFSAQMLARFFDVIAMDYDPWSRLSNNSVPMFVALGRYDYAVPYHLWDRERGIPGLTFAMFDRSAHFPMLEQSDAFDRTLLRWMDRSSR
jgi:proline iminopeptidase